MFERHCATAKQQLSARGDFADSTATALGSLTYKLCNSRFVGGGGTAAARVVGLM